jgi:hypothetical protein
MAALSPADPGGMRSLKIRTAGLLAALALLGAVPAASVDAAPAGVPHAVAAKTCPAGYTHASLSWGEKCLRAGQFCKKGANREYHRYGYHCKRNGHLRRW